MQRRVDLELVQASFLTVITEMRVDKAQREREEFENERLQFERETAALRAELARLKERLRSKTDPLLPTSSSSTQDQLVLTRSLHGKAATHVEPDEEDAEKEKQVP